MTYYDEKLNNYLVDGQERRMTEEEAEEYQDEHPNAEVVSNTRLQPPLDGSATSDYLNCTCPVPPKDGNMTGLLCKSCLDYFRRNT